jgi:peptidoglycan-associated lipoprotein
MRISHLGFCLILLSAFSFSSLAQETTNSPQNETEPTEKVPKKLQKAYEAFDGHAYSEAIELLKDGLSDAKGREEKAAVTFKIAESYRMIQNYKDAANYYNRAVKLKYENNDAQLYYAAMLKAQGEYEEALVEYQNYKKMEPSDPRADVGIESTKQAVAWANEPSRYRVDAMKDINSRSRDFGVTFGGKMRENDVLIFTSDREEATGGKEDGWTGAEFMDLFITSAERKTRRRRRGVEDDAELISPAEMKWSTPVLLDEEFVNTKDHEGMATFNSRKKDLYFTRCAREEDSEEYICGIFITEQQGQNWRTPERVIIDGDTLANVGQPSLSPDDNFLYFVSDDFGSTGDKDIFVTTYDRRAKMWTKPKNLGPEVNTWGAERFPFMHDDGYLYFSSTGLPGMGGEDIFKIKIGEDGLPAKGAKAENMKSPINSSADDFGLIFQPGSDQIGYLGSNRDDRNNDDIYAVMKTPLVFNLQGVITSAKTGLPVPEVTVRLEGSDGSSVTQVSDKDGYYIFDKSKVQPDVQYELTFEKKKFFSSTSNATTIGVPLTSFEYVPSDNQFLNTVIVNKVLDPIDEPIVLPDVFFDLARANIKEEAKVALDTVVYTLNVNPTLVIEMRSHTDYRDSDEKNLALSQRRADSTVAYLIKRGIDPARLVAKGMGETEPFVIPENYDGFGKGQFPAGARLTEAYIKSLSAEKQEIANQINRRTDFRVLRDDFVPADASKLPNAQAVDVKDILNEKQNAEVPPGEIYVMKDRESFGIIARKFKINIRDLKELNGGLRGVRPFEGLQLKVEVGGDYTKWDETHYQVQPRETSLDDIADKLEMDEDKLEELNPDLKDDDLQPGLWIKTK